MDFSFTEEQKALIKAHKEAMDAKREEFKTTLTDEQKQNMKQGQKSSSKTQ